ncbi:protein of unknown function (plasmid) [Cardinium endosymbiont cEper1 of Encarsia pergandiella]|nr:protein of unknown function [Cardinium endosymbiont cEper1 of Encarsia pergandiella]
MIKSNYTCYGKYIGYKQRTIEIANKMIFLGYKKDEIVKVIDVPYEIISKLEYNIKNEK